MTSEIKLQRYLWVFPVSSTRWLWVPLALRIASELNLRPLIIVSSAEDASFYRLSANGELDEEQILVRPDLYSISMQSFDAHDELEILQQAKKFENYYQVSFMRDFIQADRHMGRGFIWGWNQIPSSFAGDGATVTGTLRACMHMMTYFDSLAKTHPPGLTVTHGGGTGIVNKPVPLICRQLNIPFRNLASGRVGGFYYWSQDEFENSTLFTSTYQKFPEPSEDEIESVDGLLAPPSAFNAKAKGRRQASSLFWAFKVSLSQLVYRLYWRWTGKSKGVFGYRPVSSALAPFYRWAAIRTCRRKPFLSLDGLPKNVKLVVVPLQFEPEASFNGQSPESSSILTVIYETALSLPADAILVVKEHPMQMGRRPGWFYKIVAQMPNVVLLKPEESGSELIKRASLIAQINSSVGYEAAIRGIPVASFGKHGPICAIPHVRVMESRFDYKWIRDILTQFDDPVNRSTWRKEGARFFFAAQLLCMDLPDLRKGGRRHPPSELELEEMLRALLVSLEP